MTIADPKSQTIVGSLTTTGKRILGPVTRNDQNKFDKIMESIPPTSQRLKNGSKKCYETSFLDQIDVDTTSLREKSRFGIYNHCTLRTFMRVTGDTDGQ